MSRTEEFEIGGAAARRLWARVAPDAAPATRPEPALLAAWLEGRAADAEAAAVEAWIARAPEAPGEIALLRAAADPSPSPAPADFVARARAIVRAPARAARAPAGPGWAAALFGQPLLRWSAVAALGVTLALGGFEIGNHGLAPSVAGSAAAPAAAETSVDFGAQPTPFL